MGKEEKIFRKEDIPALKQLVKTLDDIEPKLEEAYEKKDSKSFNNSKKLMLNLQKQISKILK